MIKSNVESGYVGNERSDASYRNLSRQLVTPSSRTSIEPIQEVPASALGDQPTADHRQPWLEELAVS
jgi:hypothetical protein